MAREMISFSYKWLVWRDCSPDIDISGSRRRDGDRATYHVEGIGRERQRMRQEAAYQLEQEEGRVDGDHDFDAGALGPRHAGEARHGEQKCGTKLARLDDEESASDNRNSKRSKRGR